MTTLVPKLKFKSLICDPLPAIGMLKNEKYFAMMSAPVIVFD